MKDLLGNFDNIISIVIGLGTISTALVVFIKTRLIKPFKAYEKSLNLRLDRTEDTLKEQALILKELRLNGGKSVKDVVNRLESKVDEALTGIERITAIVKAGYEFDDDGIFIANSLGNCYYFNRKYLEITGLSLEEALNYGWTNAIHPLDHEKIVSAWSNTVQTKSNATISYRYKNTKSGKVIYVTVSWQVQVKEDETMLIFGRVKIKNTKKASNDTK